MTAPPAGTHSPSAALRLHAAVGLLSVALIAFQLVLIQLFSIVQWYHFAYMVISVALLGFGASGTLLALARAWLLERADGLIPLWMIACGASMPGVVWLSQQPLARFDSYLLFVEPAQAGALVLTYLLFFIPFFLGALAIGLVFIRGAAHIGRYYFANLLGSGLGGPVALGLLWAGGVLTSVSVTAALAVAAGLLLLPVRRWALVPVAGAALLPIVLFLLGPPVLRQSPYKAIRYTLDLPEAAVTLERSSPYGLVQVVASPALRHAPGLSLSYTGEVPVQQAVFNNGNWFGPVTAWSRGDTAHVLEYTTTALPYVLRPRDRVLVLHAGTGEDVAHAVTRGARRVEAVEPHRAVLDLLAGPLAPATDSLFHHPAVSVQPTEPRTVLAAGPAKHRAGYDVITLPALGAFGGTLGLFALQEQYTLTREAVREMWNQLTPHGAVAVTVWMDYPYRAPLRLLATFAEVLEGEGVQDPAAHLAAVRSWGTITFVLKRSPLTPDEVGRVRAFCAKMSFDPVLLPGLRPGERTAYNELQDDRFFEYVDRVLAPGRAAFYAAYPFALAPATDDRPYFSQFLRWKSLPQLRGQFGNQAFPFLELGYLIAGLTLVQILVAALVLILLPLVRLRPRSPGRGRTLVYFGGLGLGYLFVEMVLIQRFVFYLGHPLYATAAVLATLLIASGAGSYASERIAADPSTIRRAAGGVALLLLVYAVALTPVLKATIGLPPGLKAVAAFLLVAPAGFVMGLPFPLGLRRLAARHPEQVPWAWGINGCLSVVSAALATLLAVEIGFVGVMLCAAAAYGVGAWGADSPRLSAPAKSYEP